jgi:predicted N-acetyltransferase YhbS
MPHIAEAQEEDFAEIEEILAENGMLVRAIDGQEAMKRIRKVMGQYFLVAREGGRVVGFIRATYDGSRAIVHQMAVRARRQRHGVGRALVHEMCKRLQQNGAPTVSVTATEQSQRYYEQFSFERLPITLMLANDIQKVIDTTKPSARPRD